MKTTRTIGQGMAKPSMKMSNKAPAPGVNPKQKVAGHKTFGKPGNFAPARAKSGKDMSTKPRRGPKGRTMAGML